MALLGNALFGNGALATRGFAPLPYNFWCGTDFKTSGVEDEPYVREELL